jgi:hypothetical protein
VCRITGQILHEKNGLELDQLDFRGSLIDGTDVAGGSVDINIQANSFDDPSIEEVSDDFVGHGRSPQLLFSQPLLTQL